MLEDRALLSTLTVTNIDDSGAGSLRATIAAASSGDTIKFAPSIFNPELNDTTIDLTSGELTIDKDLTITAPTNNNLYVSGSDASRVFDITPGVTVKISNLTVTNGLAPMGGGILNDGGTLTLNSIVVQDSTALGANPGDPGQGGGIANTGSGASLSITGNSIVGFNTAEGAAGAAGGGAGGNALGGGIFNDAGDTLTLTNAYITGDTAIGGAGGGTGFAPGLGGNAYGGLIYSARTRRSRSRATRNPLRERPSAVPAAPAARGTTADSGATPAVAASRSSGAPRR